MLAVVRSCCAGVVGESEKVEVGVVYAEGAEWVGRRMLRMDGWMESGCE